MNIEEKDNMLFIDGEQVKYSHFREFELDGNIAPRGGATIAYIGDKDTIKVGGIAYCSPEDNFVFALGRTKALGRLKSGLHNDAPSHTDVEVVDNGYTILPKFIKEWNRDDVKDLMEVLGFSPRY